MLRQLRSVLVATEGDLAFEPMRAALLRGEFRLGKPLGAAFARRFMARVRAGVGGISEHGQLLALTVEGRRGPEMVVFMMWLPPATYLRGAAQLFVTSKDGLFGEPGGLLIAPR